MRYEGEAPKRSPRRPLDPLQTDDVALPGLPEGKGRKPAGTKPGTTPFSEIFRPQ